ncbi:carbon-nitrogen hydrolase family protein [Syntrophomonas palmitatica]|uniref:carbon-nitrogen hydrolase family protein n=1 Tax=Syntrophomonas palmitatica TaxID=402877 RepID=UPI0006D05088|nr:carbon-nitrogen hydrolase family protein [Syntrophomonas palmitatica]
MSKIKLAVCQMRVGNDKQQNLKRAGEMIENAVNNGAEMVVLPEVFNAPYQAELFPDYAEAFPGPSTDFLSQKALKHNICLVGGSVIERDDSGRLYNTSFVFDSAGKLMGRHRKMHLFDVNISGGINFQESATLSAGDQLSILSFKEFPFAVMICFDIRFPELARMASLKGAKLLVVPAAFNSTTGPLHWELLMRTRAVDNQVYLAAASPALNPKAVYQAWGHSLIIDPWGNIIAQAGNKEEIIMAKLDTAIVDKVRQELPVLKQRRTDIYNIAWR